MKIYDSNEKINLAAKSVKESKDMFMEISEKMDNASSLMDRINTAAQEQEKGIEQINIAINNIIPTPMIIILLIFGTLNLT